MQIIITTRQILRILYVISWIIFLGVCIEAGSFFFNAIFSMINSHAADYFKLSSLYQYDRGHFLVQLLLMGIPGVMKAIIFYLIVKILMDKKLDMAKPFNKEMGRFIFNTSYLALGTGVFTHWGMKYAQWLAQQGVQMPDTQHLRLDGADVWLFMGVTLIVIGHIFKRGIEIQSENELTV
jgi:hypothetical protein